MSTENTPKSQTAAQSQSTPGPCRQFLRQRLTIARLRHGDPIAYALVCGHIRKWWGKRESPITGAGA
jgi:hypothetical protein